MNNLPTRCVDPILKDCKNCRYGHVVYPDWVETRADIYGCCYETYCSLGYDQGRPEDEPTEEELKHFDEWLATIYGDNTK